MSTTTGSPRCCAPRNSKLGPGLVGLRTADGSRPRSDASSHTSRASGSIVAAEAAAGLTAAAAGARCPPWTSEWRGGGARPQVEGLVESEVGHNGVGDEREVGSGRHEALAAEGEGDHLNHLPRHKERDREQPAPTAAALAASAAAGAAARARARAAVVLLLGLAVAVRRPFCAFRPTMASDAPKNSSTPLPSRAGPPSSCGDIYQLSERTSAIQLCVQYTTERRSRWLQLE